ncbi:G-patch domain [Trinorchestia longiramus]|nr:G-patch domain [Trinorchestia longiramus]
MAEAGANKSFAEKQLAKFGWKKGMGLGRLNDGIAEPLRVKVRADKSGIGHDGAEDFSHWWDNAYNKAVNNLTVVPSKFLQEITSMVDWYHQHGRLVSESACERKDPGSNPAADMVDAARNTAWDLGIQPNNYRSNYPTQEWARRFVPIA